MKTEREGQARQRQRRVRVRRTPACAPRALSGRGVRDLDRSTRRGGCIRAACARRCARGYGSWGRTLSSPERLWAPARQRGARDRHRGLPATCAPPRLRCGPARHASPSAAATSHHCLAPCVRLPAQVGRTDRVSGCIGLVSLLLSPDVTHVDTSALILIRLAGERQMTSAIRIQLSSKDIDF